MARALVRATAPCPGAPPPSHAERRVSYITVLNERATPGYDPERQVLVVPLQERRTLHVVAPAQETVQVRAAVRELASSAPAAAVDPDPLHAPAPGLYGGTEVRAVTLRVAAVGEAALTLERDASLAPSQRALLVRVVPNREARQVWGAERGNSAVPAMLSEMRAELGRLGLRDAIVRVAEDQWRSAMPRAPGAGFDRYGTVDGSRDWCGAFAHWCMRAAAAACDPAPPFGPSHLALQSPQWALAWAAARAGEIQVLNYEDGRAPSMTLGDGASPWQGSGRDIPFVQPVPGAVRRGDVCLVRAVFTTRGDPPRPVPAYIGWKHVCLVREPPADNRFTTIDGIQGEGRCIGVVERRLDERVADAGGRSRFKYVFLHIVRGR